MYVIRVSRPDGFASDTGVATPEDAEARWGSVVEAACRSAEEQRQTVQLSMHEVEAPNETAAVAAVRAGMGKRLKSTRVLPPKDVARKVTIGGPGSVSEEMLDSGQKAIDDKAASYPEEARADLAALQALVDRMAAEGGGVTAENGRRFYELVYKMKSQGGTFGYPLITSVAHHLYVMARALKMADGRMIEAIQVHIDTMTLILRKRMTGVTEDSRTIVNRLHDVVVKMVGKPEE